MERTVSSYFYLKNGGRGTAPDKQAQEALAGCESFEQFALDIGHYQDRLSAIKALAPSLPHHPHLLPQSYWTHDASGTQALSFIGRFERLDEDLAYVCRTVGAPVVNPRRTNATPHARYLTYYNSATGAAVEHAYLRDVELFGYHF